MTASWAGVLITGIGLAVTIGALIWHAGRLTAILDQLTRNDEDKESRLRDLERVSQLYVAQVPAVHPPRPRRPRG